MYEQFISYWGKELLEKLNSFINFDNEYNWLKVITRKPKRVIHPIRHILFILFLCKNLEEFFYPVNIFIPKIKMYPCLNPVCKDYKKLVIKDVIIKKDYKTKQLIGIFACDCGFVYSRKLKNDIYKVGKIKKFGYVWEEKLKELVKANKYSIREIARQLRCDPKTVVKYSHKLGVRQYLNSNMVFQEHESNRTDKTVNKETYRKEIVELIKNNPDITATKIKNKLYKQYMWLYKNDREWLTNILPKKNNTKIKKNNTKIDWVRRDLEILTLIKEEYKKF